MSTSDAPSFAMREPWPYPRWVAHRGAGTLAPENTLAAFRCGAAHGYRMFECDVTLSAEGVPFLLHDATLERTTDGQGLAVALSWAELSRLDAGAWHGPTFAGEPLPSLEALAQWLGSHGASVNLELKPSPGDEARTGQTVARAVARLWAGRAVKPLLSSFEVSALEAARSAQPELPRALLLERWQPGALAQARRLGCVAVVPHLTQWTPERLVATHRAGFRALTYTVNDEAQARALWAWGLDGLITDRVDQFDPVL